jgi:hypothetical protein
MKPIGFARAMDTACQRDPRIAGNCRAPRENFDLQPLLERMAGS